MIWAALIFVSLAAVAVMAPPLFASAARPAAAQTGVSTGKAHRKGKHGHHPQPHPHTPSAPLAAAEDGRVAALKAELEELERDVAAGLISADAAEAARLEAQRRLLAAAAQPETPYLYDATAQKRARRLLPALALALPLLSAALYLGVGSPGFGDFPLRTRPDMASLRGEKLVMAANGSVGPEATAEFRAALAFDPSEARARYFLALGKSQAGDVAGALSDWVLLLKTAPKDAPWRGLVRARITEAAGVLGKDVASLGLPNDAAPATSGPDGSEAAMIRGMVERLEARLNQSPDDVEGWVKLGRSWLMLGEMDKARSAYDRAVAQAPQHVEALIGRARSLAPTRDDQPAPPAFIDAMRRVLAVDPNQPEALWHIAADAEATGRGAEALGYYQRLLTAIPTDAPVRKVIEDRVKALSATAR